MFRQALLVFVLLGALACQSGSSSPDVDATVDALGLDTSLTDGRVQPDPGGVEPMACEEDSDCARGRVCPSGVCEVRACMSPSECFAGQTCVDANGDGAKECCRVECMSDADCVGVDGASLVLLCKLGVCLPRRDEGLDVAAPEGAPEVVNEAFEE